MIDFSRLITPLTQVRHRIADGWSRIKDGTGKALVSRLIGRDCECKSEDISLYKTELCETASGAYCEDIRVYAVIGRICPGLHEFDRIDGPGQHLDYIVFTLGVNHQFACEG
jgi:hypothetical protein